MGFFDFVKKGFEIVKNVVVDHSPIVQGLESIAGIVANAIPGVGPIVNATVPALSSIFGDSSASSPQPPPSQPPPPTPGVTPDYLKSQLDAMRNETTTAIETKLDNTKAQIEAVIDSNIAKAADVLTRKITSLSETERNLIQAEFQMAKYTDFLGRIKFYISWFKNQSETFDSLTANSTEAAFQPIFKTEGGEDTLLSMRDGLAKEIQQIETYIGAQPKATQDLFELYLLAAHWLLIYDKAKIITRGLQAQSFLITTQYGNYLSSIANVDRAITDIRHDAQQRRVFLLDFVQTVTDARLQALKTIEKGAPVPGSADSGVIEFVDEWPPLAIGKFNASGLSNMITESTRQWKYTPANKDPSGVDPAQMDAISKLNDALAPTLYRTVAVQALQAHLQPALAVIQSLAESMRLWDSRLPVTPATLEKGKVHVEPKQFTKLDASNKKADEKFLYWDCKAFYCCTYVNKFGEGRESKYSEKPILLDKTKVTGVVLRLAPIQFEGDPLAALPRISVGGIEKTPSQGITRRIYANYVISVDKTVKDFVGEVPDSATEFYHELTGAKPDGTIASLAYIKDYQNVEDASEITGN